MNSVPQSPICGIYKITNLVNSKAYIGQSRDIKKRWIDHRRKSPHLSNVYLHRSIRKYGIENFSFEVLEECKPENLNVLERKYILLHRTLKPFGYNLDLGGGPQKEISEETREKIRAATLGNKNPNYGKSKSGETRRKLSLSHSPSVNQYSLDGKFIKTFSTTVEASVSVNKDDYSTRHNICACCRGDRMATYGYQWRWASDGNHDISPYTKTSHNRRSVSQFTKNGAYVATYISAKKAAEAVGRTSANIQYAIDHGGTSGGFIWRYAE